MFGLSVYCQIKRLNTKYTANGKTRKSNTYVSHSSGTRGDNDETAMLTIKTDYPAIRQGLCPSRMTSNN